MPRKGKIMTLGQRIVGTIIVNLAWTAVYVEAKGQFAAMWIMELRWSLGV